MAFNDGPDKPETKLLIRQRLALETGKAFNENTEREAMDLDLVANPIIIAASKERMRSIAREDAREARKLAEQLQSDAERLRHEDLAEQNRILQERLQQQSQQIGELRGERPAMSKVPRERPNVEDRPFPDAKMTQRELIEWAASRGISVTKTAAKGVILTELNAEIARRQAEEAAEALGVDPAPEDTDIEPDGDDDDEDGDEDLLG